jgi:sulfatase-modifying factor enzyme 1
MCGCGRRRPANIPVGSTDPGGSRQYAVYGCNVQAEGGLCRPAPVGTTPLGAGKWGQLDLAGNVSEWTADFYANYVDPCADCVNDTTFVGDRVIRGGDFFFVNAQDFVSPSRFHTREYRIVCTETGFGALEPRRDAPAAGSDRVERRCAGAHERRDAPASDHTTPCARLGGSGPSRLRRNRRTTCGRSRCSAGFHWPSSRRRAAPCAPRCSGGCKAWSEKATSSRPYRARFTGRAERRCRCLSRWRPSSSPSRGLALVCRAGGYFVYPAATMFAWTASSVASAG